MCASLLGSAPNPCLRPSRVGTGLDQSELDVLNEKLADNLYASKKASPPRWLDAGKSDVPDFWVKDVTKSVVVQVVADVRCAGQFEFESKFEGKVELLHSGITKER